MMIFIITILLVSIALVGCRLYQNRNSDSSNTQQEIQILSYYYGGDATGVKYRIVLSSNTFTVEDCQGNGYKTETKKYKASQGLYDELMQIIERYQIKDWKDVEKENEVPLDGNIKSLYIIFKDEQEIYVSSNDQLPQDGWKAIQQIVAVFEKNMK